ncbi:hypothetical protein [Tetragenococcus koreensis]|uniref:hypothetical protein n=1 Tax=Tetragenococcus koreensis TaxID=290335 RepID=UPI001F480DDA|nr:hypothetical protein [Tetragenococcus koreensis]MCF1633078.1 hypothetical protein [Tetragenococcus koreensis]MDN6663758.1 hypothetical protein [Tetragenococcus koreensis]
MASWTNANIRSSYLWFYQGLVEKEIEERMNEMFSILDLSGIKLEDLLPIFSNIGNQLATYQTTLYFRCYDFDPFDANAI